MFIGSEVALHTEHDSINVDQGRVQIDAHDDEHVIRVKHDKNDGVDILHAVDRSTDAVTMRIESSGIVRAVFTDSACISLGGSELGFFVAGQRPALLVAFGLPHVQLRLPVFRRHLLLPQVPVEVRPVVYRRFLSKVMDWRVGYPYQARYITY